MVSDGLHLFCGRWTASLWYRERTVCALVCRSSLCVCVYLCVYLWVCVCVCVCVSVCCRNIAPYFSVWEVCGVSDMCHNLGQMCMRLLPTPCVCVCVCVC